MNVESRLKALIGEPAGRLHTARSRNDQVATDFRLWVRGQCDAVDAGLAALMRALVAQAEAGAELVMPGFTHLQVAQPVTWGHHMLAYVEMLDRDRGRFRDARARMNESPLGAAALAGTSFPIDREMTAAALGFDAADGEFARRGERPRLRAGVPRRGGDLRDASQPVRRGAGDLVERAVPLRAAVATASRPGRRSCRRSATRTRRSWCRAKVGRITGALVALLTVMKGLPLAYSKDMQEDKEQVFDAADALMLALAAMTGMVADMAPQRGAAAGGGGGGLLDRDRPRRLAGAAAGAAVPRGAPRHRGAGASGPRRRAWTCPS